MSEAAAPTQPPKPGDAMFKAYLDQEALRLEGAFLAELPAAADWPKKLAEYREQYFFMQGLWPLPERTPLNPVVTGTIERPDFIVEKLHFQSRPGLYVTANLYRPRNVTGRLPAVLYVCGHSARGRNGNKTAYQHHGIWFATHGYVCLILDSLQLGEIAATHHGTYRYNRWWWYSRGYTPAGVECWNDIRALDYLQSRPEVDPERLAVTGISGGGASSHWATAADERIRAAVPVSGMSDLEDQIVHRIINGHCDCMFFYNSYQWPLTRIGSLAAPRPFLFSNSDRDGIFPMTGNHRISERLKKLYATLGAVEKLGEFVTPGGHDDSHLHRLAAFQWINHWLKKDDTPTSEPEKYETIKDEDLRAFPNELPADELNSKIDQTFVPRADVTVPADAAGVATLRGQVLARLRETTFRAWPTEDRLKAGLQTKETPKASVPLGDQPAAGRLAIEPPIEIAYRYLPGKNNPRACWLIVLSEDETDDKLPAWAAETVKDDACVLLSPRGVGPTAFSNPPPYYVPRSLAILGRTVDSGRVWDVIAFARAADRPNTEWRVAGRAQAGILGAYAALFEPKLAAIVCVDPPATHDDGPYFLSVMRTLDIPDALGLLAPRPLTLIGAKSPAFGKAASFYRAAGAETKLQRE